MGAMLGIAPVTREVKELRSPEGEVYGFEARVELVNRAGEVVGGGIGECSWAETTWGAREPYALKSMAQTRATGKAFRLALGFVMAAAGFEATPAEEMPQESASGPTQAPEQPRARSRATAAWAAPLQDAMTALQVSLDDIGRYLGERPTNAAIEMCGTSSKRRPTSSRSSRRTMPTHRNMSAICIGARAGLGAKHSSCDGTYHGMPCTCTCHGVR
jgi:hypothetical protein